MALEIFYHKFMGVASKAYKKALGNELSKMGLHYEDLMMNDIPEVAEALQLAHPDVFKGRMRRLKRASDLSFKGKVYTDYATNVKLESFKEEIWEDILKLEARNEEIATLDLYKK